jgi:hypothetical protein
MSLLASTLDSDSPADLREAPVNQKFSFDSVLVITRSLARLPPVGSDRIGRRHEEEVPDTIHYRGGGPPVT